MGEKIVIGPINKGLKTDREPFVIDNDSFPMLINSYQWRGRVKRKRGTSLLGRLQRFLGTTNAITGNFTVTIIPKNLPTGTLSFKVGTTVFTDPGTTADPAVQTLLTTGTATATLDRVNGVLTITGNNTNPLTAVLYFPTLPVMGLEDLILEVNQFPGTLAFDTRYSYNISTLSPYTIYDVSFYKNPTSSGTYTQKATWTSLFWNGKDYQQFWTVNYQGAIWVTNGINIPFSPTNIGMQFAQNTNGGGNNFLSAAVQTSATTVNFTISNNVPLVIGDFVFANEFTGAGGPSINYQTGFVTGIAGNVYTVKFPNATIAAGLVPGILQYLTNKSDTTKDNLMWYDGDPTGGNVAPNTSNGWVNFMPPLNNIISFPNYSVADLPPLQYYLVGARLIVPYKDRLLFLGPVVQSSNGNPIYLQDTVIYSQNGTAFYTASFAASTVQSVTAGNTVFTPLLVPVNQTATPPSYFGDSVGFGGFITAGLDQKINTVSPNEDVLIVGFDKTNAQLVYSGNDVVPFNFYVINSELGSTSTFSTITMDEAVLTRGPRGYIQTNQNSCQRIDLEIPDQVFQITLSNNGTERFTAQRDFINEWIYFTYTGDIINNVISVYPNTTLFFNYRDNSWALNYESYTTYGQFRPTTGMTWETLTDRTWDTWDETWESGSGNLFQPQIIGGNQQGFVLFRTNITSEATSLYIQNIVPLTNIVTCPNHCLNNGDYILITGVSGTSGAALNGSVFQVFGVTVNTFMLNGPTYSGTYLGGGVITRYYIPFIQTKQFPVAWNMNRKTRLGPQQYLFTKTANAQITLYIYLSQDSSDPWNFGNIVPTPNPENNSLIYSAIVFTCPESTNLGLTPQNTNLLNLTEISSSGIGNVQSQIWHRLNTSLIGDTVQLAVTLSDDQMRDINLINQVAEIELHGIILDVSQSGYLA